MYVGMHRRTLDAKNRLTIPHQWRHAGDESQTFLILPQDGHLVVLPPPLVEILRQRFAEKKLSDPVARKLQNKLFSIAESFSYDAQGRITVPDKLLQRAGISRDCVLSGSLDRFAIWSPERWAPEDPEATGESLDDLMGQAGI
jgi:MraZ protein